MRLVQLLLISILLSMGCLTSGDLPEGDAVLVVEPKTYFAGRLEAFDVTLHDVEGRCILTYSRVDGHSQSMDLDVGMKAPCDFIRASWKGFTPQSYSFGNGEGRLTVLLITGGTPHTEVKDEFQPFGCGTYLQRVRIYSDRIDVEWPHTYNGPPLCPSKGVDEVFFAA